MRVIIPIGRSPEPVPSPEPVRREADKSVRWFSVADAKAAVAEGRGVVMVFDADVAESLLLAVTAAPGSPTLPDTLIAPA